MRIGILSFSCISSDSRVLRQIYNASKHYEVVVIGEGAWEPANKNITYHMVPELSSQNHRFFRILEFLSYIINVLPGVWHSRRWIKNRFKFAYQTLFEANLDLIHINEYFALPCGIAAAIDSNAVALFDAHEFSLDQTRKPKIKSLLIRFFAFFILKSLGKKADSYITVSEGIAKLYKQNLGFNPTVILNAPEKVQIHKRDFDPTNIRIIHHGIARPRRNLELLIEVASLLDARYSLHFMLLMDSKSYIDSLKAFAAEKAPGKIHFHDPVAPDKIIDYLSNFDIGIHILDNNILNHKFALPNKFFDYIAAGLVVAIGPSVEMAKIVRKYDLGIVSASFAPEAIAENLNSLTPSDIKAMGQASLNASNFLNADIEMQKLSVVYRDLLEGKLES